MRVILVTPEFDPERGGVGRYLHGLYAGLPIERSLAIHDPAVWKPHWLFAIPRLAWRLRKFPGSVLHVSHVLPLGTVALALRFLTGRRYIVSLHGMDYFSALQNSRKRWLMKHVLRFASGITTNTETLARDVEEFSSRPVFVLPPSLSPMNSHEFAVRSAEGGLRLLAVARLVERKGFDTIIGALQYIPGASLTIAGDGPDRLRLEKLAAESGFHDRIEFLGQVNDARKEQLYRQHDVFVLPTRAIGPDREGFGIVFLEAQFYGMPVVGGEGIGVHEAIHPELRRHALAHTPESLAAAVLLVVQAPPRQQALREFAAGFDQRMQSQRFWKWLKSL